MNCSTPGLPVHHQLPEFTQILVLSRWCHPAISSSVVPFSSCPQSLPASDSFPIGSHIRHYWQNGGTAPGPLSFCRHGPGIKELGLVILTCFFPLLGWVDWKGMLRCLLFLRGAWEGTKPSAAVLREQFINLIFDICLRTFTKECSRMST